jgi:hypothetical protein
MLASTCMELFNDALFLEELPIVIGAALVTLPFFSSSLLSVWVQWLEHSSQALKT